LALSDLALAAENAQTGVANAQTQTTSDQTKLAALQAAITADQGVQNVAESAALTALMALAAEVQLEITALQPPASPVQAVS
jgi:hypothetical protein